MTMSLRTLPCDYSTSATNYYSTTRTDRPGVFFFYTSDFRSFLYQRRRLGRKRIHDEAFSLFGARRPLSLSVTYFTFYILKCLLLVEIQAIQDQINHARLVNVPCITSCWMPDGLVNAITWILEHIHNAHSLDSLSIWRGRSGQTCWHTIISRCHWMCTQDCTPSPNTARRSRTPKCRRRHHFLVRSGRV
jgi:hypothetical protein